MRYLALALLLLATPALADIQADPRPITWKNCSATVVTGGTAVTITLPSGPIRGFYLQNPDTAANQGIATAESLFFDPTGTAVIAGTSPLLTAGQVFQIGPGTTLNQNVSINATTSSHKFLCMIGQ